MIPAHGRQIRPELIRAHGSRSVKGVGVVSLKWDLDDLVEQIRQFVGFGESDKLLIVTPETLGAAQEAEREFDIQLSHNLIAPDPQSSQQDDTVINVKAFLGCP